MDDSRAAFTVLVRMLTVLITFVSSFALSDSRAVTGQSARSRIPEVVLQAPVLNRVIVIASGCVKKSNVKANALEPIFAFKKKSECLQKGVDAFLAAEDRDGLDEKMSRLNASVKVCQNLNADGYKEYQAGKTNSPAVENFENCVITAVRSNFPAPRSAGSAPNHVER